MTSQERIQWSEAADTLAKEMRPTRSGPINIIHYLQALESLFHANKWDYKEWCDAAAATNASNLRANR